MEKRAEHKEIGDHLLYKLETEKGVQCVAALHANVAEDYYRYVEISSEEYGESSPPKANGLWMGLPAYANAHISPLGRWNSFLPYEQDRQDSVSCADTSR